MADVQWIKIVTDVFDNRKIRQIEKMPEGDAILVVWFKLLCLAGNINNDGLLYLTKEVPYTVDMLSTHFNKPQNIINLAIKTFLMFGMIEVIDDVMQISNWEKYQNIDALNKIREQTRKRVGEYRQRKQLKAPCNVTVTHNVTQCNATDKEIDIDIDKERKILSPSNDGGDCAKNCEHFNTFWSAYPKKIGKAAALKAWEKHHGDKHIDKALKTIERMKQTEQWKREGGRFIPNPTTWINQGRWDDEVEGRQDDLDELF